MKRVYACQAWHSRRSCCRASRRSRRAVVTTSGITSRRPSPSSPRRWRRRHSELLPDLVPEPDGTPPAGFVVLHRGGNGAAYLNAYTWVWDNVLHMRGAAAAQAALGCPDEDPTHFMPLDRPWIGCVWELPPIQHERDAWVRHMLMPDVADLAGYLDDTMPDGTTGTLG